MIPGTPVPLAVADIDDADIDRVVAALRSGWLTHGPYNAELEAAFAAYLGVRHAICVNSCASALHLAMMAQGIRGEVILPSFTFVASANAVVTAGARPVFADIASTDRNLDPAAVAAAVTPRTEAIMAVHYAGQPCDMDGLRAVADRHGLALIEDSAEAIGAAFAGRKTGTFGTGCFSFYPTKNMTTGEGGLLTTDADEIAEKARTLMGHGIPSRTMDREGAARPWLRAATMSGYNFRMSNVLAALGVGQLARLDAMNARRSLLAAAYDEALAGLDGIDRPQILPGRTHVWQMYTILLRRGDRDDFVQALRRRGIGASVHFDPPVHRHPAYATPAGVQPQHLPVTDGVAGRIVTLPLFPGMTDAQHRSVCDAVRAVHDAGASR